jgi:hypothetical protein
VATSLLCDTQTQLERFVALFSRDTQAAVGAVNSEEHNPTACALVRPRVAPIDLEIVTASDRRQTLMQ